MKYHINPDDRDEYSRALKLMQQTPKVFCINRCARETESSEILFKAAYAAGCVVKRLCWDSVVNTTDEEALYDITIVLYNY